MRFTGLEEVRAMVGEHRDALAYAVLVHAVDRAKRIPVARINLAGADLKPFVGASGSGEPGGVELRDALMRRVVAEVERHLSGARPQTYMLRLYQPKGRYLQGRCFQAERDAVPGSTALTPIVVPLNPDLLPEARVWRALGGAVEDFAGTVIRALSGIVDAEHRISEELADQLARSWSLVEALTEQLQAERAERARLEADRRADDGARWVRDALVGKLLEELVALGLEMSASRGAVPAELGEVFDLVVASPELLQALCDPEVRAMLRDPGACEDLARHLLEAARRGGEGGS